MRFPLAVIGIVLVGVCVERCQAAQRPNIVFIIADDLGYGDISCYGQKLIRTPNLQRLSEQGMRFVNPRDMAGSSACAWATGRRCGGI